MLLGKKLLVLLMLLGTMGVGCINFTEEARVKYPEAALASLEKALATDDFELFNAGLSNGLRARIPDVSAFRHIRQAVAQIDKEEDGFVVTWSRPVGWDPSGESCWNPSGPSWVGRLIGKKSGKLRITVYMEGALDELLLTRITIVHRINE